jgi:N utilization substance protein A
VPDDQLSLAIGKEGQNARLAARLTGYKIDIKPASQAAEFEQADEAEAEPAEGSEAQAEEV